MNELTTAVSLSSMKASTNEVKKRKNIRKFYKNEKKFSNTNRVPNECNHNECL